MENFYQVFVRQDGRPGWELLLSDLDEKRLRASFLRPYDKGERVLIDGDTVDFAKVSAVKIVRTAEAKAVVEERLYQEYTAALDRNNRTPGVTVLGLPPNDEDIAEAGDNVTSQFVKGPAGSRSGPGILRVAFEHPIIAGVIGSVVAALILWLVFGIGA